MDKITVPKGRYILAVSGGVDSMALLDILSKQTGVDLVIAHFDHGIRPDSYLDKELVEKTAASYGLTSEFGEGKLGPGTSEDKAREARYRFLNDVKEKRQAKAIITAHHQDDLIETAFLNILRGSGRRGLSAISASDILRPLLGVPKSDIIEYAQAGGLVWREDSTNSQPEYLRNYLRQGAMTRLDPGARQAILGNIQNIARTNQELDAGIATLSQIIKPARSISRAKFIQLPQEVADELVIYWLRRLGVRQFKRQDIRKWAVAIKTAQPGTRQSIKKDIWLDIGRKSAHFTTTD